MSRVHLFYTNYRLSSSLSLLYFLLLPRYDLKVFKIGNWPQRWRRKNKRPNFLPHPNFPRMTCYWSWLNIFKNSSKLVDSSSNEAKVLARNLETMKIGFFSWKRNPDSLCIIFWTNVLIPGEYGNSYHIYGLELGHQQLRSWRLMHMTMYRTSASALGCQ